MRKLRIGTWVAAVVALAAFGCDDGNGTPDGGGGGTDGGGTVIDSGPGGGTDSGTGGEDSGTGTDTDSGTGGGTCGPTDGECDISDPDSCGSGMACLLNGGTTECFPAGTGTDGASCDPTMAGQCAEGFGCGSEGVCRRWCCSNADCNPPGMATGQVCNFFSGSGPDEDSLVGLCAEGDDCSPVDQSGCPDDEACNLFTLGLTICDTPGTATEGEECENRNGCVGGFACISTGDSEPFRCREYCDPSAASPCPTGFACGGITGAPEDVGVCVPME